MTTLLTVIQFMVNILVIVVLLSILVAGLSLLFKDKRQEQYSVLRNFPILGRVRYPSEEMGPELRQYLFADDTEGRPFSRSQYTDIILVGKYHPRMTSFNTEKDYEEGFYTRNAMFPLQKSGLQVDSHSVISTLIYSIDNEQLSKREEHRGNKHIDPYYLSDGHVAIIGEELTHPFKVKRLVGQSGMSYGSLSKRAITALSQGLARAGTQVNTGEGGLSEYHLRDGYDIVYQIGPGLFGVRNKDGGFSEETFLDVASYKKVKAFEIKLAQGAKIRGGHMGGNKVTGEIAKIRHIGPYKTINSPDRFDFINNPEELSEFVAKLQKLGQKPVGFKIVVSRINEVKALVQKMIDPDIYPSFITVDGGEDGTGATFQELQDDVGLSILIALPIVTGVLGRYDARKYVKMFAFGKLITPDKVAIVLGLGTDLYNIARGMMTSIGCIMNQQYHLDTCPISVATTDPKREKALIVEERQYRVTNYVTSLHEGLFSVAAAVGVKSPNEITGDHIVIKRKSEHIEDITNYKLKLTQ